MLNFLRNLTAPEHLPSIFCELPYQRAWPLTPEDLDVMLRHHHRLRCSKLRVSSGSRMAGILDQELTAALQVVAPALYRPSRASPLVRSHPAVHRLVIAQLLAFVRRQGLGSAHYFGHADEGLITVLRMQPGFNLGVTDYYDRWHSGLAFWGLDDGDPPIDWSQYPIPESLTGVIFYQEGMIETRLVIFDLPRSALASLREIATSDRPRIDFIALVGSACQLSRELGDFSWRARLGVKFGTRSTGGG